MGAKVYFICVALWNFFLCVPLCPLWLSSGSLDQALKFIDGQGVGGAAFLAGHRLGSGQGVEAAFSG